MYSDNTVVRQAKRIIVNPVSSPYKRREPRPKKIKLLAGQPEPQAVSKITQAEDTPWTSVILAEGAKGPIIAEVITLRVYLSKKGLPENNGCWLFIRRSQDGQI